MSKFWRKYRRMFLNQLQATLAYKANFFAGLFMKALGFLVMIYIWKAVYAQSGTIAGFSFKELLTYFLLVEMLRNLMTTSTFDEIKEAVRRGRLANFLLVPVSSLNIYLVRSVTETVTELFFFIWPVIGLIALTPYFSQPAGWPNLLLALAMTVVALFSSMFIYTLLGSVSFWTVETGNIIWAFNFIVMFLAGKMIPLQFFPEAIRNVMEYSPFAAIFNLPASIYLGKLTTDQLAIQFLVQMGWVVVIYIVLRLVWRRGLKQLELVGG
jgi:ABC-2 type transport system permease protein